MTVEQNAATAEAGDPPAESEVQLDTEEEGQTGNEETPPSEAEGEPPAEPGEAEETVVTIGDEEPPQDDESSAAPEWVRELRKSHRETVRENRELKEKLKAMEQPQQKIEVGPKPKLEDFEYDADEFETALSNWYEKKREADEVEANARLTQEEQERAWQNRLKEYGEAKAKLNFKDVDDAEGVVTDLMDQTQQGIIIQGAENPALVIYALGKNHSRARELATVKDPVKFAFAVAKLEKDLKVTTNRKAPPPPEKTIGGTGSKSGAVDSTLERLRADAEKTGDYTKVVQYKRQKRQAKS